MSLCLYFQVHQPFRLKDYSFFRIGSDHNYGATQQNYAILQRVSDLCYLPANELMLKAIKHFGRDFKITYSISGTALEQLAAFRPDVIDSFKELADTGSVEFLAETQYHSLAALYSKEEFLRQVHMHQERIKTLIGYTPTAFRNTELIYGDALPAMLAGQGFEAILAEGVARNLQSLNVGQVFKAPQSEMKVLLRNGSLSDDIAFRLTDPTWSQYPLSAETYAGWVKNALAEHPEAKTANVWFDYETLGEHRRPETGIFDFMEALPRAILDACLSFATPTEIARAESATATYSAAELTSWADADRDLSAWTFDRMQQDALARCYALEPRVRAAKDPNVLEVWGRMQTSDHFYYMSTRYWADAAHQAFTPYASPYDAYINYMNVLMDFEQLIG